MTVGWVCGAFVPMQIYAGSCVRCGKRRELHPVPPAAEENEQGQEAGREREAR